MNGISIATGQEAYMRSTDVDEEHPLELYSVHPVQLYMEAPIPPPFQNYFEGRKTTGYTMSVNY